MPYHKLPLYAVKFLKTPNIQKKNQEIQKAIENLRSGVKTPSLAQLDKSFKNLKKVTPLLEQVSNVLIFYKNAIHINTVKQYQEIVAMYPHCLSGTIMLQIT